MSLSGIDISYSQATTPALGGLQFVVVKASQANFVDSHWSQHSSAVRAAGLPLGAYCFGVAASRAPVAVQADLFLSTAKNADFLALDLEHDGHWPTSMTKVEAADFIARVHAAGRRIGLYHSDSSFPDVGQDWNWVAKWSSVAPSRPWTFWQYQGSPLDRDKFAGDSLDAFLAREKNDMPLGILTINPLAAPNPRKWVAPAGTVIKAYDPARPGVVTFQWTVPAGSGLTGHADAEGYIEWPGDSTPPVPHGGPFIHVKDNALWPNLNQQWVREGLVLDPAAPAVTQAQVDAAYAAGFTAAKAKAVSAVSNVS